MNKCLSFLLSLTIFPAFCQIGDTKLPSYFGVQVRSIIPTNFVGNPITTLQKDGLQASLQQTIGYSFGGIVRVGLTELIALETGINFSQRYFKVQGSIADSGIYVTNQLGFIQYDLPLNGLIYIKLTKRFFANASLGVTAGFKPTSIATQNNIDGSKFFYHTGFVNKKASLDLNGNLGFEFRSKKSGFFYLGAAVRLPLAPLFTYIATYRNQGYKVTQYGDVSGAFLGIDLRYFFRNVKGQKEDKRPIE
ncbi:MAG: hypothetical protein EB023_08830 [Flavobacteriia bacterium]|nr:hypothetical protein [Flavobacteriia bacterium]